LLLAAQPSKQTSCHTQNWEWPLVWEGIFTTLGLDFEVRDNILRYIPFKAATFQ